MSYDILAFEFSITDSIKGVDAFFKKGTSGGTF